MKRIMLVAVVSMAVAFPVLGRPMGSVGGGRSAMGSISSGPRISGGAIGGFHGSVGTRGSIGGGRSAMGSISSGPRISGGGFRGSVGALGGWRSGPSLSHSVPFAGRSSSGGWFSRALPGDFGFGFSRRHFDRDVFLFSFGYPFANFYYPFYGSFGLALGFGYYPFYWDYPYYPYYYYPYYGYGPVYVYPPYAERNDYRRENRPAQPSSLADQLTMQWQRHGTLLVGWSGAAAKVRQVEFSLLDSHRQLLELQVARRVPYHTIFSSPPDEAVYVQMAVIYTDGSVDSVVRPLPDAGTTSGRPVY
jgi:hypothetical protein